MLSAILVSCEAEHVSAMRLFYDESVNLPNATVDSIKRFATKVETYVYKFPEERKSPYYPEIVDNIKAAAQAGNLVITITIETEWEGEIDINF